MTVFQDVERLRQHRPMLLACEAIGWFHMLGKARADFLRKHGGLKVNYDERGCPLPLDELLGWLRDAFGEARWPDSFTAFAREHAGPDRHGILGLLQAGHGMASGVEKQSYYREHVLYLGQDITHMWLCSAFGHPERNLLIEPPEVLTEHGWHRLVDEATRVLKELQGLGTKRVECVDRWIRWRHEAVGHTSYIRKALLSTLAETRVPNNDVTLWDQSYVAAALFKSAVAGALLDCSFPWQDSEIRWKVRWRLLTVGIGTDHYESRAISIGDWTGSRAALEEFFRQISAFVEVDLALGSLVYRDSSVCVYTCPGERYGDITSRCWDSQLNEWLQTEADKVARSLNLETPPLVTLSAATRSLIPLVRERRRVRAKLAIPVHRPWEVRDGSGSNGHNCPVCHVRLNESPVDRGQRCHICEERRAHRLEDWLDGRLGEGTIWLEEIADTNNRIALLTFQLDVEPWLGGECFDSLRAQAIPEWKRFNPRIFGIENPIGFDDLPYVSLKKYVQSKLEKGLDKNDPVLKSLQEGYGRREHDWKSLYEKIVEDRADAPPWDELNYEQRASWLSHQLLRKLPSPGRVYRFWRETEQFFRELFQIFGELVSHHANRWRVKRLWLVPDDTTTSSCKDRHMYDGRWHDKPVSLVYHAGGFLTACNLARVLDPEDKPHKVNNAEIELWEADAPSHTWKAVLKVKEALDHRARRAPLSLGNLGVYSPIVLLELSPLRFRVLVPLEAASQCVDLALARWRESFARVLDRLPLHVGVVAFPAKTPFQAVLEMARFVEAETKTECYEHWLVDDIAVNNGAVSAGFRRKDGEHERWQIPIELPDGRKDVFYPYVAVGDDQVRLPLDFQAPAGQVYRHVADLRSGSVVCVYPARIATVFMDTTARRFEKLRIRYLSDWCQMRRVWSVLRERVRSLTQLSQIRRELTRLADTWNMEADDRAKETWLQLAGAILRGAVDVHDVLLDEVLDAARTGIMLWALDWHLSVLKEKLP